MAGMSERLIVALDVPSAGEAQSLVSRVGDAAVWYKVGLQLFTAEGPQIVRDLVASGRKVFLDLKLNDIPNTVGEATRAAAQLGVGMLTVHASGGAGSLRAAAEAAAASAHRPLVLAVTVLTSLDDDALAEVGVSATAEEQVLRLAAVARAANCGGLVASAHELKALRGRYPAGPFGSTNEFNIVVPGIRPAGADHGDQARAATPGEALAAGATYLVVGRPITKAASPAQAAREILLEMEAATVVP